jgi:hypothetical protein
LVLNEKDDLTRFAEMAERLAQHGWFVRVETVDATSQPAVIYFAVGKNSSREAIAAVLDDPRIERGDQVTWIDQLTPTEILSYVLGPDEVRTYGKRTQGLRGYWLVQRPLSKTSRSLRSRLTRSDTGT